MFLIEEKCGVVTVVRPFAFASKVDAESFVASALRLFDSLYDVPGVAERCARTRFRVVDAAAHPEIQFRPTSVDKAFDVWCGMDKEDAEIAIKTEFPAVLLNVIARRLPEYLYGRKIDLDVGPTAYVVSGEYAVAVGVGHVCDSDGNIRHESSDSSPLLEMVTETGAAMLPLSELRLAPEWIQRRLVARCAALSLVPRIGRRGNYRQISRRQLKRVV